MRQEKRFPKGKRDSEPGKGGSRNAGRSFRRVERNDSGPIYLFGRRPVQEVLLHAPKRVQELILEERLVSETLPGDLRRALKSFRGEIKRWPREKIEELDLGNHQGVLARLSPRGESSLEEIIDSAKKQPSRVVLVLDEISDPQNLGSIFRAAEAFSVAGIVLTKRRSATITGTVVRVSAGASELLPIATVANLQRALETMQKAGIWVIGTELGEEAKSLSNTKLSYPLALVFGSEGEGMRDLTRKLCDELVEIPLTGRMQSLNVNQATSIVLYEASRQYACSAKEPLAE